MFLQCGGGGVGGKRQLLVGGKTALAFHRSEPSPPSSSRTGWVMHEYRLAAASRGVAEQRKKNASHVRTQNSHHDASRLRLEVAWVRFATSTAIFCRM